jgi:hypothetical protein
MSTRYGLHSFVTSELVVNEWLAWRPVHLTLYAPLNMWLAEAQSRCGRFDEQTNILFLPGNEPRFPGCLILGVMTIPTELPPAILITVRIHFHNMFARVLLGPWQAKGNKHKIPVFWKLRHTDWYILCFVSQSFPLLRVHSRCRGCLFSLDHTQTHTPQSVGLLWTRDRPVA